MKSKRIHLKTVKQFVVSAVFLISLVGVLSACSSPIETNMSSPMADFSFLTQDKKELGLDDLKDDWWIAYFSYTSCRTVCPRTTASMVKVQSALKEEDLHPQIISFNVDPENDGPEELRAYAAMYGVDLRSWDFLTGYEFETIQEISEQSFQATLEKGAVDQVSHSYLFYLINPDGEVVKSYNGMGTEGTEELIADMKAVVE
jgi:protein SCO1/2